MDENRPSPNGHFNPKRPEPEADDTPSENEQRPAKRQRVLACRRCRSRKQKCEDTRPCTNCTKSNAECVPTDPAPRQNLDSEYVKALEERIAELESLDPQQSLDHIQGTRNSSGSNAISHNEMQGARLEATSDHTHRRTSSNPNPYHAPRGCQTVPESPQVVDAQTSPASIRAAASNLLQEFPDEADQSENDQDPDIDHLIFGLAASPGVQRDHLPSTSPGNGLLSTGANGQSFPPHAIIASIPQEVSELLLNVYRERAQTQYPFFHWDTFISWHHSWKVCQPAQFTERAWQGFFVNVTYATALLLRPFPRIGKSDAQTFYSHGISLLPAVLKSRDPILHVQAHLLLSMYALHRSSTQRILSLSSTTIRYCVQHQFHLAEVEPAMTPAVHLRHQIRRRCFWCAYKLDRLIVASFDLPPSIPDAMITVKVFANIEDNDIIDVATRTPQNQDLPDAPKYTSVSPSLHILQCRRIQSEIAGYTLRYDYAATYEKNVDWRVQILAELENYKARTRKYSDPQSKGYASQRWLAMIYQYTLLCLYRPTKENVTGPAGDWSVQASSQACLIFRKTQMDRQIASPWIALLVQFQSGVTLLYCFWATPPEYRTENYDSPDIFDGLRACSNILAIMADKWPKADCLRDVFELLAREVPLVDRPNRPPTRFSERSVIAIREKLPEVRALVVHRSILRMIEEMISEDFPRLPANHADAIAARTPRTAMNYTPRNDHIQPIPVRQPSFQELSPTWTFEMPFQTGQMYDFGAEQETDPDALLAFPGMYDFDNWT